MQVKAHIKASILLGLFSLLLLHQTIPHSHHDHQEKHKHRVAKTSHDHSHAHEHEHEHEKENESEDSRSLWSVLLAMHSHGGNSTEVPVVEETIQHILLKKVKTESSSPQSFLLKHKLSQDTATQLQRNYQPPPKYLYFYSAFLSLRGPPQLV